MVKRLMYVLFALFLCGATPPRSTLTLPWDYILDRDSTANVAEHNLSAAPVWSFVLNGARQREVYSGVALTYTTPSNVLSFKLMLTVSRDFLGTTDVDVTKMPELYGFKLPIKELARVQVVNRTRDYILMPALTLPLLHYKLNFYFSEKERSKPGGAGRHANASAELRTGMAGDLYLGWHYGTYTVSLFDGEEMKFDMPNKDVLSDNWYPASLTTVNIDFAPLHSEFNLILSGKECKFIVGAGVIW